MSESNGNKQTGTEKLAEEVMTEARKPRFPHLVAVVLLAIGGGAALGVTAMSFNQASVNFSNSVVAFDTVKLVNAQRSLVGKIIGNPQSGEATEASLTMAKVNKDAAAVVKKYAQGRAVIVRQALALPESVEDITDKVLVDLGLPTDVPTIAPVIDDAPIGDNNYSISEFYQKAEKALDEQRKKRKADRAGASERATDKVLP